MATFDVDGYRKAAKAAGISNAEIENEIKFQTSAPAKSDPFEKDGGGFKLGSLEQVQERLGNDWWHLPAGLAIFGAAATGLKALMDDGFDDPNDPNNKPKYKFDPTFDVEPLAQQPTEPVKPSLPQQTNLTPEDLQARAAVLKAGPVAPPAPQAPAPTYTAPIPMTPEQLADSFAGRTPQAPISTPLSAAPIDAPAPTPSAAPNSPVTSVVVDELKEMLQEDVTKPVAPPGELRTGTGKPAFAGQGPEPKINKRTGKPQFQSEYGSLAEVPKGYAVVPEGQYIDVLRSIGQPEYLEAFTGRKFPTDYEQAVEATKEINRQLGRPTRAEAKAAGQPYGDNVPGITQRTTTGKKLVNVGGKAGIAGALVALSDLAKAETPGQRGMAGANLLEAVLPPGFMMGGAGEGSDMPPRARDPRMANINMTNASMFAPASNPLLTSSPYAQSPQAKKLRQEQEYVRKIGAGRGIAPPSAYQR